MRLTFGDKLEIMLREGSLLIGAGMSLVTPLALITGLSASDDFQFEFLLSAGFSIVGLLLIYQSVAKHQLLWLLTTDPILVTGNLEANSTTVKEIDGHTLYRVAYSYQVISLTYTHCVETEHPEKYGSQERIFVQRSRPANAVFAIDLPSVVRKKLLSAVTT